jgi:hypothetical protein
VADGQDIEHSGPDRATSGFSNRPEEDLMPLDTTRRTSLPPQPECWIFIYRCFCAHMAAWVRLAAWTFLRMLLM